MLCQKSKKVTKPYSSDALMEATWCCLAKDFTPVLGPELSHRNRAVLKASMVEFRKIEWPAISQASPSVFKRVTQLKNFYKRYISAKDSFTQADLDRMTNQKFLAGQMRLASTPLVRTERLHRVLQRARIIIKQILGEYDMEEHMSLCRFGKRASVGTPAKTSYLDVKLGNPMSGSLEHIEWFKNNYLPTDPIMQRLLNNMPLTDTSVEGKCSVEPPFRMCDVLVNTNVPKSWDKLRGIMPNTLLGSFYTHGLGKMIEQRLKKRAELDISKLQILHQEYARQYSITRKCATGDMSDASNSYLVDVVNMLMPRKWYNALKFGRIKNILMNGQVHSLASFMGMGIGFTFPLQTLCFYAILKSIAELSEAKGRVSVYGDDLIYPSTIHNHVVDIFTQLRFIMNKDKTFVHDNFRESCGGDFFHGVDVRPYQPEGQSQLLSRARYLALLYKTINGLLRRWTSFEIRGTLVFLFRECIRVTNVIHQVPLSYPDFSGVKVEHYQSLPRVMPWGAKFNPKTEADVMSEFWVPWSKVRYDLDTQSLMFPSLYEEGDKRVVNKMDAYYWETMRFTKVRENADKSEGTYYARPLCGEDSIKRYLQQGYTWKKVAPKPILSWMPHPKGEKVRLRSGTRVRRLCATVALKAPTRIVSKMSSITYWTLGLE